MPVARARKSPHLGIIVTHCANHRDHNYLITVITQAVTITVRHGSADTVVRAMNVFNGKRCFGGSGENFDRKLAITRLV